MKEKKKEEKMYVCNKLNKNLNNPNSVRFLFFLYFLMICTI